MKNNNKIILVGDCHFGIKNTIEQFVEYQESEFDIMIKYALDNNIKNVVFLGDILNDRKNISIKTIDLLKRKFNELSKTDITFYIIIGNHDTFYKNTNEINSPRILFDHLDSKQFIIIDKDPKTIYIENSSCDFIPWMSKDTFDDNIDFISKSISDFCFGHFEINGFVMNNTNKCKSTLKASTFKNIGQVFSGHFHTMSQNKNIIYTGSLCQLDWNDYGLDKGFFELDLHTKQYTLVKSNNHIFKKVLIGNSFNFDDCKDIKNSFLKIYINRKLKTKENVLLGDLISNNISYEIIDNTILENIDEIEVSETEDFNEIVTSCVQNQDLNNNDKNDIIDLILEKYTEMKKEGDN